MSKKTPKRKQKKVIPYWNVSFLIFVVSYPTQFLYTEQNKRKSLLVDVCLLGVQWPQDISPAQALLSLEQKLLFSRS
jgi:hypothetical protein